MHQYPTVCGRVVFIRYTPTLFGGALVIHNNFRIAWLYAGDGSFKFLPDQLWMVVYWTTMASMGNELLGQDFGEGA